MPDRDIRETPAEHFGKPPPFPSPPAGGQPETLLASHVVQRDGVLDYASACATDPRPDGRVPLHHYVTETRKRGVERYGAWTNRNLATV